MFPLIAILATLNFTGNFSQGGLVQTFAPEGTEIIVNGEKADCYGQHCLIGFGRSAPETANITVNYTTGATENYIFPIKQVKYDIQYINKVDQEKVTPNPKNEKRIEKEAIEVATKRIETHYPCPNELKFVQPSQGLITGLFGSQRIYNGTPRAPHSGVDFKGKTGDPIFAPENGEVIFVGDLFMTGLTMLVDHGCGLTSSFAHLSAAGKKVGDVVSKGEAIAKIGKSGLATGPHLHWGINLGTTRLDPLMLLK